MNPKELLELGIRKELINEICKILDKYLQFKKEGSVEEFEDKISKLSSHLSEYFLFDEFQNFSRIHPRLHQLLRH